MESGLSKLLRAAGWLPPEPQCDGGLENPAALLEQLATCWRIAAIPPRQTARRQIDTRRRWFEQQFRGGASFTLELPTVSMTSDGQTSVAHGERLCWFPRGLPERTRIGIVSSRLGKRLDQRPEWFAAFRSACAEAQEQQGVVVTGRSTTTARFLERAATVYQLPLLVIHEPRANETPVKWLRRLYRQPKEQHSDQRYEVLLSPLLNSSSSAQELADLPLSDLAVFAWVHKIYILQMRRGGNIERLVRGHLQVPTDSSPKIYIAADPRLVPDNLLVEFVEAGAIRWTIQPQNAGGIANPFSVHAVPISAQTEKESSVDSTPFVRQNGCRATEVTSASIIPWQTFVESYCTEEWNYLTHCTRAPCGPWPDETEAEYLDELILRDCAAARSSLAALIRILQQQRIVASAAALRGGVPAVCFTAVPLNELHELRVFQPQRHRWDFEPYGICIQRRWLERQNARPVIYGEESDWRTLSPLDRPFFQLRQSQRNGRHRVWAREQEWRHLSDVPLSAVPTDMAFTFVKTLSEAQNVAKVSEWPVVLCQELAAEIPQQEYSQFRPGGSENA